MDSIGAYSITGEIGRGGMGTVYRGVDPATQRPVAIKIMRPGAVTQSQREQLEVRFAREASVGGKLSHPNIVAVYQFGQEGDSHYMVMELVSGASLEQILTHRRLPASDCMRLLKQTAAALDHAHASGVYHRDVKPANILVESDLTVKLTDFGIAKVSSETITKTGFTMGTPAYMAPEQIRASKVDGRTDQFALAVIAFQMLSGRRPFEADSDYGLMFQIVNADPLQLCAADSNLPSACSAVMEKALSKSPADRYGSCGEFVSALAAAMSGAQPERGVADPEAISRRVEELRREVRKHRNFLDPVFRDAYVSRNYWEILDQQRPVWQGEYDRLCEDRELLTAVQLQAPEVMEWFEARIDMVLASERLAWVPSEAPPTRLVEVA